MAYREPFIADLVRRLAPKLGAKFFIEPEFGHYGYIDFPNGRRSFFCDNRFDLNTQAAVRVAADKGVCRAMLKRMGFSVPDEITFWPRGKFPAAPEARHIEQAIAFAGRVGYPVFVKPVARSQGKGVSCCFDEAELREASEAIFATSDVAIVQPRYAGRDYRVAVLDGRVIQAYERIPLEVRGDGRSSIVQLIEMKHKRFREAGRDTTIRLRPEMKRSLARIGMDWSSRPARGRRVRLTEVSNLSIGGTSREMTAEVHPRFRRLCVEVARSLNLRFCGIDLMTASISRWSARHVILEVNASPGLDHYAIEDENAQQRLVDRLYLKVLRAVMGDGRTRSS
jgi:D-alanine-D-alanine ligase-like ATP-grasp enzyme